VLHRPALMFLAVLPLTACQAHWVDHPDLPEWAARGRLHWCLHYSTANREKVDLFLDGKQTLVHGGAFDSDETAEYARHSGLRYMPYVCSRTVTVAEIERNPQLRDAVVLVGDGGEFLAYNNPARRYGSLYMPAWPEHVRERSRRQMLRPNVSAVFFDNAFWAGDDHREATVRAWQAWAEERGLDGGDDVPATSGAEPSAASRAFAAESLVDYHAMLHEFCRGQTPPLLNCPNGGAAGAGLMATEAGAIDLVFSETMSHPPFVRNGFLYKAGLAASHGKPTGLLAYLPASIAAQRGRRTWHEGMHHFFYPSSPHAEEFALAAAEGAACGGTYIPNYNLFPSLPITDVSDPFCRRIHRAIKQSYQFLDANEDLYAGSRPGSDVAVYLSSATEVQGRRLQNARALGDVLSAAGMPYEVVVAADLTEEGLAGIKTLIVPNAVYVRRSVPEGLLRFVRTGGRLVLTGEFASYDDIGLPMQSAAAQALVGPLGLVSEPIRSWDLEGFEPEGVSHVKVSDSVGTARLEHQGEAGLYVAHVAMNDEGDGTSTFDVLAGDRVVYRGTLDEEDDAIHWHTTPPFRLEAGTVVCLRVKADAGERGRVQAVVVTRADAAEGVRLQRGRVAYSPVALETLDAPELIALLQPWMRLDTPGDVFINVMDIPDSGMRTVHLVNYGLDYEVDIEGLYATDDGSAEARTFFGNSATVLRKQLQIAAPAGVARPVVQIHGFATTQCQADLVIRVNGRRAGSIPAREMVGRQWHETPIDRALLRAENTIELRVEGQVDGQMSWIQVDIDVDSQMGASVLSLDDGATFSAEDLSPDRKAQTGEYMVRIVDRAPGEVDREEGNLVANPGFEQVTTPHAETQITVMPARDVRVVTGDGEVRPCLAISPEQPPVWVTGLTPGDAAVYVVPEVRTYTVLVMGPSREALANVYDAQMRSAPWRLPAVTEPLRSLTAGWQAYGDGFAAAQGAGRSGDSSIVCESPDASSVRGASQQLTLDHEEPQTITLTAWSRCEGVSGRKDPHYSVYVDAVMEDGTVFNGHNTPFEVGSHDWQQAELVLTPPQPIRSMTLYLLFRKHSGKAWFDDVRVTVQ